MCLCAKCLTDDSFKDCLTKTCKSCCLLISLFQNWRYLVTKKVLTVKRVLKGYQSNLKVLSSCTQPRVDSSCTNPFFLSFVEHKWKCVYNIVPFALFSFECDKTKEKKKQCKSFMTRLYDVCTIFQFNSISS